jgi:hypothetical protein
MINTGIRTAKATFGIVLIDLIVCTKIDILSSNENQYLSYFNQVIV